MTLIHHTRSREEWRYRFEQHLITLTNGRLPAVRYIQLSAEVYDLRFDEAPEDAARCVLRPSIDSVHDETIALASTTLYLGRFRPRREA